jgi:hypothetical protein
MTTSAGVLPVRATKQADSDRRYESGGPTTDGPGR